MRTNRVIFMFAVGILATKVTRSRGFTAVDYFVVNRLMQEEKEVIGSV